MKSSFVSVADRDLWRALIPCPWNQLMRFGYLVNLLGLGCCMLVFRVEFQDPDSGLINFNGR